MKRDYKLFLQDIRDSVHYIEEYMTGVSEESFRKDRKLQDAVIRRFEIIGEASRKIPRALKEKNKHINWFQLSQFRDLTVHSYFEVSVNRILDAVKNDLQKIKEGMKKITFV